jgi:DNA-binding transcriptional ArsR family regulator
VQQEILITNQLDTGSAFALTDQMENVFIPSKVMHSKSVRPGQKVQAIVVPNATHGHKTPWMAVTILDDAPIQPPQGRRDTLAELILENLDQGRATVEEIAEDLNMSDESVANKLSELVADGHVVRLTCFDLPEDVA